MKIYKISDMEVKPKFKVGDIVKTPKDLYKLTDGIITKIERGYLKVDDDGKFDKYGLELLECDIAALRVPYLFDGKVAKLSVNGVEETYKFYEYLYNVKSLKITSIRPEKQLKLVK